MNVVRFNFNFAEHLLLIVAYTHTHTHRDCMLVNDINLLQVLGLISYLKFVFLI